MFRSMKVVVDESPSGPRVSMPLLKARDAICDCNWSTDLKAGLKRGGCREAE
jgi:hypothetical protein